MVAPPPSSQPPGAGAPAPPAPPTLPSAGAPADGEVLLESTAASFETEIIVPVESKTAVSEPEKAAMSAAASSPVTAPDPAPVAAPPVALDAEDPSVWAQLVAVFREHGPITGLLLVATFVRSFRLSDIPGKYIGDETWYIQAARVIAGFPVLLFHLTSGSRSGLDPNREHPPLAKLIIAGSMKLLGNREIAARLPSVLLGTLAIWLLYRIILKIGGTQGEALFAAFVLTFDNLFMIHGRIATLDIYLVTFSLLATLLYFSSYLELAGIVFAVAALCKTNAVLGLATVLLYDAFMARAAWRHPSWDAIGKRALCVGFFTAFFLLGLGTMDCFFTPFHGPFEHLAHMGHYHANLTHHGPSTKNESTPFDWWLDEGTFKYFFFKSKTANISFNAALNGYVVFVGALAMVYAGRQAWKVRSPLGTFAVASLVANFGPIFLAWAVMSRTSYIYYMVPVLPALACALGLAAYAVPTSTRWGFVVLVLYAFVYMYPIRLL